MRGEREVSEKCEAVGVPEWRGGFLDVNGSVYFNTARVRNPYSWPVIRFSEESLGVMERIRSEFGAEDLAIVPSKSDKSNTFTISRLRVVSILQSAEPYAPSRKVAIEHVRWWKCATTARERYEVALSYKEARKHETPIDIEEYRQLVDRPQFVAGLIDAKGCPFGVGKAHRVGLRIYSQNDILLQSLHEQFRGSRPIAWGGTHYWSLESGDYSELLAYVEPYLRVYPARVDFHRERNINS